MSVLPIDSLLPAIGEALAEKRAAVIQAPPGAGKTTRVPLVLLNADWLAGRKIVMLEPRRLAARAAANYMAKLLGERVAETVGYRVRMDTRVGPRTRIEVATEGVLTRLLQSDPSLSDYGLVIFDEFHERSLHADLALALCLETRQALRLDLRLAVMSATLDAEPVAHLLGDPPLLTSEGRSFPVDTRYRPLIPRERIEPQVTNTLRRVLKEEAGGVLVFLPGGGEIRRVAAMLDGQLPADTELMPLYGDLPQAAQDAAILPAAPGRRKLVLATTIAETSLTIEGVRVVVDAGLSRVPHFDPVSGLTRLATVRVSRASADQRRGRAGRLEPGVCYRLWSEGERLEAQSAPEILQADLAPLALELAQWGAADVSKLAWLDPPPAAALAQARELLQALEALDGDGRISDHGRRLLELPLHPRLAHMVVKAAEMEEGALAALIAAILSERDILSSRQNDADIATRLALLVRDSASHIKSVPHHHSLPATAVRGSNVESAPANVGRGSNFESTPASAGREGIHEDASTHTHERGRARLVWRAAQNIARQTGITFDTAWADIHAAGRWLALAYPDRIAKRRAGAAGHYLLANGRGAFLAESDVLAASEWLAVAELDGDPREARIFLAAALSEVEVRELFAARIEGHAVLDWDETNETVVARNEQRLGAITLEARPLDAPDPEQVLGLLIGAIRRRGLDCFSWTPTLRQWQARVMFLRHAEGESWPDVSDVHLLVTLGDWLAPYLSGCTRLSQFANISLRQALESLLDYRQQKQLDELAPTHFIVPTGSRIPIDYAGETPVLAVRLQELFGLARTPSIARGKVPLLLHLLSPAHRPVQVTRDLAGFWRSSYQDVKKDMKGRYPKHLWPDDPLRTEPTRHAKRPAKK
ncbi:MAG: ATP-dependent helicase HrpB [Gammaproteobacteria bacterium]